MKVTLISIPVRDQEKALKFYTEKLGFIKKRQKFYLFESLLAMNPRFCSKNKFFKIRQDSCCAVILQQNFKHLLSIFCMLTLE